MGKFQESGPRAALMSGGELDAGYCLWHSLCAARAGPAYIVAQSIHHSTSCSQRMKPWTSTTRAKRIPLRVW